jgi:hypothetical protein
MGLATRARALQRLGMRQAADDARAAVRVARSLGDPAVLLDCLIARLEIDGSDLVLRQARQTAGAMLGSLSSEALRSAFIASLSEKRPQLLAGRTH